MPAAAYPPPYVPGLPAAAPPGYGPPAWQTVPPPSGASAPYGAVAHGPVDPYGFPAPPGPGYGYGGPVEPPVEGLATASLATSVGGLLVLAGLPGPVGVGLGIGALRRIRRHGTRGRGLAIAGVVVGAVSTLVFVGLVCLAIWGWSADSDVTGGLLPDEELPDYTMRADLVAGDCLREYPASWDLGTADPVDCGEAHAMEIVAVLPLTGPVDSFTSPADAGYDLAFDRCAERIHRSAPGLVDEWTVWTDVSFPHPDDWADGATTAYCAVATELPDLRGSVLDGSATGP